MNIIFPMRKGHWYDHIWLNIYIFIISLERKLYALYCKTLARTPSHIIPIIWHLTIRYIYMEAHYAKSVSASKNAIN